MDIRFIHNWNGKLDSGLYTTIRKYAQDKLLYYDSMKGEEFNVLLKGKVHSVAELIAVNTQELHAIPFGFLALDTGIIDPDEVYEVFKGFGIEKSDRVIVLLFRTTKRMSTKTSEVKP